MKYPHDHENDVIYFGRVNFRNSLQTFGIKTDDRRRHMYVIGKTGMGKTTLLENLFLSDVYAGHGCCYIDPHGDTAEKIIDHIPSWRIQDVVYFNPADLDFPMGFNILESVDPKMRHLVAAGLMGVFKKIWEGVWSARMEYIMNNTILALLDTPGTTLLGINRMLSDEPYRTMIIKNIQDPIVKQFWLKEFANYQDKFASEAVAPIQNKVGQFISASIIRNIVAQAESTLKIREIMDDQKIFVVNLSKGRVGEDASRLLGGMLITKIQMAAMERVDMAESERNDFYLYVDEFQNFAVESFASILSEARKYRLNLIMAHQYIAQLTEEVRDAVFGNVGSIISFRVGSPDAQFMEDEFMPRFTPEDIINLPKFNIYLKLMIDGVTSQPFSAVTLSPIAHRTNSTPKVIEFSRQNYGMKREIIEQNVIRWSGFSDDVDVDAALADAKQQKKDAKKAKYMHKYNCKVCNKEIELPVELDRNKPIFCEEHHPKNIKAQKEQQRTQGSHQQKYQPRQEYPKKDKRVVDIPPKVKDGEIIQNEVGEEVSLVELKKEKEVSENTQVDNSDKIAPQKENKSLRPEIKPEKVPDLRQAENQDLPAEFIEETGKVASNAVVQNINKDGLEEKNPAKRKRKRRRNRNKNRTDDSRAQLESHHSNSDRKTQSSPNPTTNLQTRPPKSGTLRPGKAVSFED
jgi:hypothetical protein